MKSKKIHRIGADTDTDTDVENMDMADVDMAMANILISKTSKTSNL